MKKYLGIIVAICFALMPFVVNAASKKINLDDYKTLNLDQALEEENITKAYKNYKETDDQVTIYLFRGNGCGYCRAFLTFLNNSAEEYGKYFKVVSFETWYDEENYNLMNTLSTYMGSPASGVPFIIIGDQVYAGYSSEYDDSILSTIKSLYGEKEKFDVVEEYNKEANKAARSEKRATATPIIWNFVFTAIATACVMVYVNKSNKKLIAEIKKANKPAPEKATTTKKTKK